MTNIRPVPYTRVAPETYQSYESYPTTYANTVYEEAIPLSSQNVDFEVSDSILTLVKAGLSVLAIPVAAVIYFGRRAKSSLAEKAELLSIPLERYTKPVPAMVPVPVPVTDLVSLQCYNGSSIDMVVNNSNYRVAMVSGRQANTQHIRSAVFALFERFTEKGVRVVMLAQEESRRSCHNHVGTEQMLLGIIGEGTGLAARMLRSHGMDLKTTRGEVAKLIGRGEDQVGVEIPFTPRAKKVLDDSQAQAVELGHNYIGTEHLLLALLKETDDVAAKVFENMTIDREKVRTEMLEAISDQDNKDGSAVEILGLEPATAGAGNKMTNATKDEGDSVLSEFAVNLTERARAGLLDPVVGRENEIERVIQVLGRRTKNNPCLIGEPGVGKTAVAEGLHS